MVDLSDSTFDEIKIPDTIYEHFLSGVGLGAYILSRISSNGVCRPQKYSIPRFFSVTTFSHSLRFSGV